MRREKGCSVCSAPNIGTRATKLCRPRARELSRSKNQSGVEKVKKEECRSQIVGKISAHPNPVPYDHEYVIISWETNDPAGGKCGSPHLRGKKSWSVGARRERQKSPG